jgi:hypothetical protein
MVQAKQAPTNKGAMGKANPEAEGALWVLRDNRELLCTVTIQGSGPEAMEVLASALTRSRRDRISVSSDLDTTLTQERSCKATVVSWADPWAIRK